MEDTATHTKPQKPGLGSNPIRDADDARRRADGQGASSDPTPQQVIRFAWRRVKDSKTPPAVKLRYLERIGEYMGLWGPKSKPKEAPEAIPPVVEEEES